MLGHGRVRIFLSSTFVDLRDVRAELVQWLSGVFGAELIVMETFGSDAEPPDVNSVRRVRECDLFVAIYGHRYGTVDDATGESITELELDEARRAHSAGTLRAILLYLLDHEATWLREHEETDEIRRAVQNRLRDKARQHTYTPFRTRDELFLSIMRDVYRTLQEHFNTAPLQVRPFVLPAERHLGQPVGMEFLTSPYRKYLIGRSAKTEELITRLNGEPIALLLGESGIGKTSLIHAGLLPAAAGRNWRPIYTRPFKQPCTDILNSINTAVFGQRPSFRGSLVRLLAEVSAAVPERTVLLVIDQFEDVLTGSTGGEMDELIDALSSIRELSSPDLRVLISYRSDLEARLGAYWQAISGSPLGLPRTYLLGMEESEAWSGVVTITGDLGVTLLLTSAQEERIKRDLLVASHAAGFPDVYPPYVQMLVDHMWSSSHQGARPYTFRDYRAARGMDGVVGGYLTSLLRYARDQRGHVESVLIALVRSYGVKAQRTIGEIVADTQLDPRACELALDKLLDLRLVRHVGEYYEIAHDFIAQRIVSELVGSEEREFKRFRELLASKAAAYQTTANLLTAEELLMLFKHRQRVVPGEQELHLILVSWLEGTGPALYWLLGAERGKLLDWLRAEETKENLSRDEKVSIVLLRKKLGEEPLLEADYSALRGYQLSAELAGLIVRRPALVPPDLVLLGLRHIREEVRTACLEAVVAKLTGGDWSWIRRLRGSSSPALREAYQQLVLRHDVPTPQAPAGGDRDLEEFALLKRSSLSRSAAEAEEVLTELQRTRPRLQALLFARGLTYVRQGRMKTLLVEATRTSIDKAVLLLAACAGKIARTEFTAMLSTYEQWNSKESQGRKGWALQAKSTALANGILRCMSKEHLSELRRTIARVALTPSSRGIVLALLRNASLRDLRLVLGRVAATKEPVDYWNHTQLAYTAGRQIEGRARRVPRFLLDVGNREEFWTYVPEKDRAVQPKRALLPIQCIENRRFYVRLAAYGMIGAASSGDEEVLTRLADHEYELIARTAAARLVSLLGEVALQKLAAKAADCVKGRRAGPFAGVLRAAEMEHFGLAALW